MRGNTIVIVFMLPTPGDVIRTGTKYHTVVRGLANSMHRNKIIFTR